MGVFIVGVVSERIFAESQLTGYALFSAHGESCRMEGLVS